jgi:hypothetical protein
LWKYQNFLSQSKPFISLKQKIPSYSCISPSFALQINTFLLNAKSHRNTTPDSSGKHGIPTIQIFPHHTSAKQEDQDSSHPNYSATSQTQ